MKKRYVALACCVLLIASFAWYGTGEEMREEPYVLYFQERDLESAAGGGALRVESAHLAETEGMDTRQIAEALMLDLLDGPVDETLKSTIPAGTALNSLELDGSRVYVDLSYAYSTLSGVALTLADQSVALTLTQLPGVMSVKITVRGQELAYRDKQVFTGRDVLLAPEGDVVSTVNATLYFLSAEGLLTAEERTLELYEGDTQVSVVVEAMENGPVSKELTAVLPEGFRTRAVWLEEDVCYVNLSSSLLELLPEDAQLDVALEAMGRSLCSLEAVEETRFLVDGEYADAYGPVNIGQPYTD